MLHGDHCADKSPIVIDKKYPEEKVTVFDDNSNAKPEDASVIPVEPSQQDPEGTSEVSLLEIKIKMSKFETLNHAEKQTYFLLYF